MGPLINKDTDSAWQAIADALGRLGFVFQSHEEVAAWVSHYLFASDAAPARCPITASVGGDPWMGCSLPTLHDGRHNFSIPVYIPYPEYGIGAVRSPQGYWEEKNGGL